MYSIYLGSAKVALTTSFIDIEIPELSKSARGITIACFDSENDFINWEMAAPGEIEGELQGAIKAYFNFAAASEQISFKAKVLNGTGTLNIGFWR